jgi:hypothetical protein
MPRHAHKRDFLKMPYGIGIMPHMEQQIKRGQAVIVSDAWGTRLSRKVVEVSELKVWVCSSEEFERAMREHREPACVGFPKEDVEPNGTD